MSDLPDYFDSDSETSDLDPDFDYKHPTPTEEWLIDALISAAQYEKFSNTVPLFNYCRTVAIYFNAFLDYQRFGMAGPHINELPPWPRLTGRNRDQYAEFWHQYQQDERDGLFKKWLLSIERATYMFRKDFILEGQRMIWNVVPPLVALVRACTIFCFKEYVPFVELLRSRLSEDMVRVLMDIWGLIKSPEHWKDWEIIGLLICRLTGFNDFFIVLHSFGFGIARRIDRLDLNLPEDFRGRLGDVEDSTSSFIIARYEAGLLRDGQVRLLEFPTKALIAELRGLIERMSVNLLQPGRLQINHLLEFDEQTTVVYRDHHTLITKFLAHKNFRSDRLEGLLLRYLEDIDGVDANLKVVEGVRRMDNLYSKMWIEVRDKYDAYLFKRHGPDIYPLNSYQQLPETSEKRFEANVTKFTRVKMAKL